MEVKEAYSIVEAVGIGFIEKMFMPDLKPETYAKFNKEMAFVVPSLGAFLLDFPTFERANALIRAVNKMEFWMLRKYPGVGDKSLEELVQGIIKLASDTEDSRQIINSPLA